MSQNQPFQGQTRPKTILNDYGQPHPETEQPLQGARYNGAMRFEQKISGEIVLRCFDNIFNANGPKAPPREVSLNYNERGVLFDTIRSAANLKEEFVSAQIPINQKAWIREGGASKLTPEPVNNCNLIVSRDDKGRVSLTYQKGDYSFKVVFRLHNAPAIRVKLADGSAIEDFGAPSRSSARIWCNWHEAKLNEMEQAAWKPREPKNGGAGGGNGGNQSWKNNNSGGNNSGNGGNNGGGGSMNQTTEDFDDDVNW